MMTSSTLKLADSKILRYVKSYVFVGKHIGFYGNFGHGDLGDDASFMAARDLFGGQLLPISKRSYAFNPRIMKGFLVGGGGTLHWDCPYVPRRLLLKEKWEFPVILFSAGVNCDYDKEFSPKAKEQIKKLCSISDYITVRDKLSQKFIEDYGFRRVHLLPDLELVLEDKPKELAFKKEGHTVGIVLSPHSEFEEDTLEKITENFKQFTDYLTEQGHKVLYIPFEHRSSQNKRERDLILDILKDVKNPQAVKVLENDLSPQELLHVIKNYCDVMVCMRLHSAIFATNAGVPFFCVSYNMMHKGYVDLLDLKDMELPLFDQFSFDTLKEKFAFLTKNHGEIQQQLIRKRDELREVIHMQIDIIKNIIE